MPPKPAGKSPASVSKLPSPGVGPSATGLIPTMVAAPTMIRASTATTLISESQNSVSPNTRAETALSVNSRMPKTRHQTHTLMPGNHRCMRMPDAVNSLPSATAQHSQYSHAVAKPQACPRFREA